MNRFLIAVLILFMAGACKQTKDPSLEPQPTLEPGLNYATSGELKININHFFKDQPLVLNTAYYINKASDTFNISELRYYLSNVTLHKPTGEKVNLGNYDLHTVKQDQAFVLSVPSVPAGNYSRVTFYIGVDKDRNHSGAQEGALDPDQGMIWTWNTGYVFMRMKGRSPSNVAYSLDLGGDANLPIQEIDLSAYKNGSATPTLKLKMDINEMFENPEPYSLKTDANVIHMPSGPAVEKLAKNMHDMVKLVNVE